MKTRGVFSTVLKAGVAAAIGLTAMVSTAALQAKELRFVHAYPVASQHNRNVEWYTQEVTKRSNGEITFKVFPSAQVMPINQELPGILSGQISMTYSIAPIVASVEPLWDIFSLPFLFDIKIDDIGHGFRFFKSPKGGGILAKAMEKRGFKLLAIAPTDEPSGIYLTKNEPVRKLEDLKGLKLRIPGGRIGQMAGEEFGFSPIAIAGAELVPALTQGVVDGAILPPIYTYDNKLPVNGLSAVPFSWPGVTPIIMSLAEFNSLTADQQKVMVDVAKELEDRAKGIVEASAKEKLEKLEAEGKTVVSLSDEEAARWREKAQKVWKFFADEYGEDAKTMLDEAIRLHTATE